VHGNGDHAALWITTLWRMESNGVPRERMLAINFTDPLARTDDKVAQANRSSTEDQRRELGEADQGIEAPHRRVARRAGRQFARRLFDPQLHQEWRRRRCQPCRAVRRPNHGVYRLGRHAGSEFNGRGPFLRGLNEGESEVTPGTAFLTLRSDGNDKFAQADGRFAGKPGTPTGVTSEGPALKGATNLVLGALDHREVAFHPRAFARSINSSRAGSRRASTSCRKRSQTRRACDGDAGGVVTNRPVSGATVEIYRVSPDTGERPGGPIHSSADRADGRWGPAQVEPELASRDRADIGRRPPRISTVSPFRALRHRASRARAPMGPAMRGRQRRPDVRGRGYFGLPATSCCSTARSRRCKPGVRPIRSTTLRLAAGRSVGRWRMFNQERSGAGLAGSENGLRRRIDLLAIFSIDRRLDGAELRDSLRDPDPARS
jgi:hypothetical protein